MFVQVVLRGRRHAQRLVVPRSALRGGVIHIADADDRLRRRPVEVLYSQHAISVVSTGIEPGERVVVSDLVPAVEDAVCRRLEDALESVTDLDEMRCDAREGLGKATAVMREGADMMRFLDDVESEVDAIDDFPQETEPPVTEGRGRTEPVISIAASLAFGLSAATIAALFLVPAVYAILDDLGWLGALEEEVDEGESVRIDPLAVRSEP